MANYADYLAHFDFDVIFKSTNENTNADYCSRVTYLLLDDKRYPICFVTKGKKDWRRWIWLLYQIEQLPVDVKRIAQETRKDPEGKIVKLLEAGQSLERAGYFPPSVVYKLY